MIRYALFKLLDIAQLLILIRCIISWFPVGRGQLIEMLYTVTEPILAPIRALINKSMGGRMIAIDFSPIVAFILIGFLQKLIASFVTF